MGAVAQQLHPCSAHQPVNLSPTHGFISIVGRWRSKWAFLTSARTASVGHQHVTTTQIYARVYDATVEADYRKAMNRIARDQMPLSDQPLPVANWPSRDKLAIPENAMMAPTELDNSV